MPSDEDAMTDDELWAAYVGSDDEALEPLIDRHNGALFWYLLLSTGRQRPAVQHTFGTWDLIARWRRPHDGFDTFKGWLYAVATQSAVPAGHPEGLGLTELMEDVNRSEPTGRWSETFFRIADMHRHVRQPFLLVTVAGLSIAQAARACNFSEQTTARCVETAYRRLARTRLFKSLKSPPEDRR